MAKNTEAGSNASSDCEDKIVKRSLSKNLNKVMVYLTSNTK